MTIPVLGISLFPKFQQEGVWLLTYDFACNRL
ncbi:unnamed protein product, partial [Larinioides sclopetarius]